MVFLPLVDVFGDEIVAALFSETALVESWLEVERALAAAQAELGIVPAEAAAAAAGPARPPDRLRAARSRVAVVQLFGAAGTAAALGPDSREVRHRVAALLSLGVADVPWHTARDALAEVGFVLAAAAATCAK